MLHASIKNHLNFLHLLLNFKICYSVTNKIFFKKKKIKSIFDENTDQSYVLKKSDLHLMKIQISFVCKKIKFVFNENTNQFYVLKKSYLYLMKIQISF